jgi:3-oxoacyl-[acyl-carrier protein] reductase
MPMVSLDGKVAIVTGASKGIGAAIAKGLAQAGAKVVVNYHSDLEGAERAIEAIKAGGGKAVAVKADVSKASEAQSLFDSAIKAFGRLDVLVNNAGVYRFEPFEAVTEAEFHRIYNTNVLGPLLTMQEAIKRFGPDGGAIINIATTGISTTAPMSSTYTSSKAALVSISRVLAKEFGPRKIRVNVVAPGATETEGAHAIGVLDGPMVRQLVAGTPLGRLGQPEDMVGPVVFLASDAAHWVTGEVLFASGGSR